MWYVGVDGCHGGWLAIALDGKGGWEVELFPDVATLWVKYQTADLILIDIPIGLVDGKNDKFSKRPCDARAKEVLGERRNSVWFAPCRKATDEFNKKEKHNHDRVSTTNKAEVGYGLSIQTWSIMDKINQVNGFILDNKVTSVRETHPEVCFWALNGYRPMKSSKRSEEGLRERKRVLCRFCPHFQDIIDYTLNKSRRSQVVENDILDALVAAVTATRQETGELCSLSPQKDFRQITMEIVYPKPANLPCKT